MPMVKILLYIPEVSATYPNRATYSIDQVYFILISSGWQRMLFTSKPRSWLQPGWAGLLPEAFP